MSDLLDILKPNEGSPERAATSPDMASEDAKPFDWVELDADCIVVREQRSIACYRNRFGSVVIREESDFAPDEDAFLVLRDDDAVRALIRCLQREIGGQ